MHQKAIEIKEQILGSEVSRASFTSSSCHVLLLKEVQSDVTAIYVSQWCVFNVNTIYWLTWRTHGYVKDTVEQ